MAECTRQKMKGTVDRKARDSETWTYLLQGDAVPTTALQAIDLAHTTGPNPVPYVGTQHPSRFIFVQTIDADQTSERRDCFAITVHYGPLEPGENEESTNPNPLSRPAVYDIAYVEQEYVIEEARNVEAFGPVFSRAPGTLGPIVNATFDRPDEPKIDTTRNAVIVIEKNVATLGAIMQLNETYQLTTNSDTCNVGGCNVGPNRLKFLGAFSVGRQQEGDIVYYPCRIEIELKKTTDLRLMNVSYRGWDPVDGEYKKAMVEGEPASDPVNIDLGGEFCGDTTTVIPYRYLEEVAYANFFS